MIRNLFFTLICLIFCRVALSANLCADEIYGPGDRAAEVLNSRLKSLNGFQRMSYEARSPKPDTSSWISKKLSTHQWLLVIEQLKMAYQNHVYALREEPTMGPAMNVIREIMDELFEASTSYIESTGRSVIALNEVRSYSPKGYDSNGNAKGEVRLERTPVLMVIAKKQSKADMITLLSSEAQSHDDFFDPELNIRYVGVDHVLMEREFPQTPPKLTEDPPQVQPYAPDSSIPSDREISTEVDHWLKELEKKPKKKPRLQ